MAQLTSTILQCLQVSKLLPLLSHSSDSGPTRTGQNPSVPRDSQQLNRPSDLKQDARVHSSLAATGVCWGLGRMQTSCWSFSGAVLAHSSLMGSRPWALKPFHYSKGSCMCRRQQGKSYNFHQNVGIWKFWNLH